jgi:hypothetical protein
VPAGRLIKIDAEILDTRIALKKNPQDAVLKAKIDALLKQRQVQIAAIQRKLRSGD